MNKEILLTDEQIEIIQKNISINYRLSYPYAVSITTESDLPTVFETITPIKHLILVKGNDDTGYTHICKRHNKFAFSYENVENPIEYYKDNPTSFHQSIVPFDYKFLIDQVYDDKNLNNDKNKRPDIFDCYSGEATHKGIIENYVLILYKNTKIVHSFFPLTRNKKNNFPYIANLTINELCVSISQAESHFAYIFDFKNSADTIVAKLTYKECPHTLSGTVHADCLIKNENWISGETINYYPNNVELKFKRDLHGRAKILYNFRVPNDKILIKKLYKKFKNN